jgi:adenine-specific DNA-methyltransferase
MSSKKTKLELTWIGKEHRPRLEPRILLEEPDKSHHAKFRVREPQILTTKNTENTKGKNAASAPGTDHPGDIFDNMLIRGDNLLGLKALEQEFAGKVKCVYIDPPYNTGSAFEHYDDGLEHSIWLNLMRERLALLWNLLDPLAGSIWISIDDSEVHYLKILCDEVFGRKNFVTTIIWQQRTSRENRRTFSNNHEYLLVFAKDPSAFGVARNDLDLSEDVKDRYKNPDNDPRGAWQSVSVNAQAGHATPSQFYTLIAPNGKAHEPPNGRCWLYTEPRISELIRDNRIWFGKDGNGAPRVKKFFTEAKTGLTPQTLWLAGEVGTNDHAKKALITMFHKEVPFDTPKPESLIQRVLQIATNPGDLVLDSFLGSGTTAAVAHKMGRRWIGIELGEHCETHCLPRLKKVVDGEDPGGITKAVGWKGGGGFRYYRLAPSLLEKDKWDNWVVSKEYNAAMLAEAVCKLEGFSYEPSDSLYWQHGHSTERDFIYTTTANLSHDQLQELSDEVGPERSLLVVCSAFRGPKEGYPNLTVKKIPNAVLSRCEWGKDDYSLKVENLPKAPPEPGQQELF